jgi:thiol-disulfide isomerase/thioredoxin
MLRRILVLLAIIFCFLPGRLWAKEDGVAVHIFFSESCPHCAAEREFFSELKEKYEWLEINEHDVAQSKNVKLFREVAKELGGNTNGVPFTVICDKYLVGFSETNVYKEELEKYLVDLRGQECREVVIEDAEEVKGGLPVVPEFVKIPLVGEVRVKDLSLPTLTFVVALLDGFNPCAMWVLLFLISLLLGMEDRVKMWTMGGVFILASGLVYFMFLAAWLSLFLFLGFITWVRVGIGLFALGVGGYYLRDYQKNKAGVCKVTGDEKRKKIFDRLREIAQKKNFVLALGGIILLAFAVNLVELICSAGLPAVYTQVLAMTAMPRWQYYCYLIFYIIIFMLDDMIVFGVAMTTLHAVGISGKYARYSHLIGGIVMVVIGILMLLKPGWLMFGG